jgi:hypothetical protein
MTMTRATREKAKELVSSGLVHRVGPKEWAVEATSCWWNGSYTVQEVGGRLMCECKGYQYRGYCKHIEAVRLAMDDEDTCEPEEGVCIECGRLVPNGLDLCVECGRRAWRSLLLYER